MIKPYRSCFRIHVSVYEQNIMSQSMAYPYASPVSSIDSVVSIVV